MKDDPTALGFPGTEPPEDSSTTVAETAPHWAIGGPSLEELPADRADRYDETGEIGRGGMGVVLTAKDHLFGREVAVKKLLNPDDAGLKARFLEEARVSAQLEHPNVVPVHDLGVNPDGEVYFTMKMVRGRSLSQIIGGLESGDPDLRREFSRLRLLTLFQQVCMGVHYAHSRGVIHRDLKPDNIMVGEYGEVYVMDWGIAKVLAVPADEVADEDAFNKTIAPGPSAQMTAAGAIVGTPSYMPPEQAKGEQHRMGPSADVYALGATLYEILTGEPPYRGPTALATIVQAITGDLEPPSRRAPGADIPAELDEICIRALAGEPLSRHASARELYDEIEDFLEGRKEAERRADEAERLAGIGRSALTASALAEREMETLRTRERELEESLLPQAPAKDKRPLWTVQDRLAELERDRERQVERALRAFGEAVRQQPEHEEARRALAERYWKRYCDAEDRGATADALHYRSLVELHNDGAYDALLLDECPLEVATDPPGASAALHALVEEDRVLVEAPPVDLGRTPTRPRGVARGSYVLKLRLDGFGEVRQPVLVGRGDRKKVEARLFPPEAIGEGFVLIPGGPSTLGGDPDSLGGDRRRVVDLPTFVIAKFPVTCGEYLEFLNATIDAGRPEEAERRAPREWGSGGHYWVPGDDGRFQMPITDRDGDVWDTEWPVMGVSFKDAGAYCEWRAERDGTALRLPTAVEWEKAARGVDGRFFPWGNSFDPIFCKMRLSRPDAPLPEPVGAFPTDTSPYGVHDMAGGVREWTSSAFEGGLRMLKGGAWNLFPFSCRAVSGYPHMSTYANSSTGFRLAKDLP